MKKKEIVLTETEREYKEAYQNRDYVECHKIIREVREIFGIDEGLEIVNRWEQEVGLEYRPDSDILDYK